MTINRTRIHAVLLVFAVMTGVGLLALQMKQSVLSAEGRQAGIAIPTFEVDPTWPKKLPNDWVYGAVSAVRVDAQDHVWALTRPRAVVSPDLKSKKAAPSVIEFDAAGNFVQGWGWGEDGAGYEWPESEHGFTVDTKGNVWITGAGHQIPKFTKTGKFLLQIGRRGQSKGNADTQNFDSPEDIAYYAKTNEVFVADGNGFGAFAERPAPTGRGGGPIKNDVIRGNRRVIVFDADTGKFKRMWGAFGNVPVDPKPGDQPFLPDDAVGDGPRQFNDVHSVRVSNDGLVYVCDRFNFRVQVFTVDGKYVTQTFIARGKMPLSTATGTLFGKPRKDVEDELLKAHEGPSRVAFSSDPAQRFLYVIERRHQKILILDRKTLEVLGSFGGGVGERPGEFYVVHDIATDSKGNVYTVETNNNSRIQKFTFKGLSASAKN